MELCLGVLAVAGKYASSSIVGLLDWVLERVGGFGRMFLVVRVDYGLACKWQMVRHVKFLQLFNGIRSRQLDAHMAARLVPDVAAVHEEFLRIVDNLDFV